MKPFLCRGKFFQVGITMKLTSIKYPPTSTNAHDQFNLDNGQITAPKILPNYYRNNGNSHNKRENEKTTCSYDKKKLRSRKNVITKRKTSFAAACGIQQNEF